MLSDDLAKELGELQIIPFQGFLANDLVYALWARLREKKIEMTTQLEPGLELQAA